MIDAGWRNIKFKTIKSGSDGDLAFNIGSVSMDQPSGSGTAKVKGKYLDVYRRQRDGSWKIIATMYNTDSRRSRRKEEYIATEGSGALRRAPMLLIGLHPFASEAGEMSRDDARSA